MKFLSVFLVLLAASAVSAAPVSEVVDSLCPEVKAILSNSTGDFSTLFAALNAIGDVDITIPEGDVTIVAPTNAAFADLLAALDVTPAELLANTDLVAQVVSLHIIGGSESVAGGEADITDEDVTVDGAAGPVPIIATVDTCADADVPLTVLVTDTVIVPAAEEAAAPGPSPAGPVKVTIKQVVDGLCKPIKDALAGADLTAVSGALAVAGAVEIEVPENDGLVIFAPQNAAFGRAVAALGVTTAQLLSNTDLVAQILSEHVGVEIDGAITNLAGNEMTVEGEEVTAENTVAPAPIAAGPIECTGADGSKQTAYVISEVIVPTAIVPSAPTPAPVAAPAKAPTPMMAPAPKVPPAAAPSSSAVSAAATVAAGVVMAAAIFA